MPIKGFATGQNARILSLLKKLPPGTPPEHPVKDAEELARVLRAGLPHGRMASLPKHLKEPLTALGVPFPKGKDAPAIQRFLAQLEQNRKTGDESWQLQYLHLQQAIQNESQAHRMLSTIMKGKHDTAKSAMSNLR